MKTIVARPPGPFRAGYWRSPVRGPWLTSYFGSILLVGIPVMFVTGLISYAAYDPRLAGNDTTPGKGILGFYLFNWVSSPSWIYRVSQGTHVLLGLTLVPIVLAKLWSVIPKLFEWPALRSVAHGLERLSLMLVVGGAVFEFATGIADIEYYYPWKFNFYEAHLYGAWVFITGFAVHVSLKLPTMWRSLRRYSLREILSTPRARTTPEPGEGHGLVASEPASPTISRRGVLGLVGGSSLAVFLLTAGGTVAGLRRLALLSPRARSQGDRSPPGGERLRGQPGLRGHRDHGGRHGRRLAPRPERPAHGVAVPRRADGDAASDGGPPDLLCRGMVHRAGLDGSTARRPRAPGGRRTAPWTWKWSRSRGLGSHSGRQRWRRIRRAIPRHCWR